MALVSKARLQTYNPVSRHRLKHTPHRHPPPPPPPPARNTLSVASRRKSVCLGLLLRLCLLLLLRNLLPRGPRRCPDSQVFGLKKLPSSLSLSQSRGAVAGVQEAGFAVVSRSFGERLDRTEGKSGCVPTRLPVGCRHPGLGGAFRVACSLLTADISTSTPKTR